MPAHKIPGVDTMIPEKISDKNGPKLNTSKREVTHHARYAPAGNTRVPVIRMSNQQGTCGKR